jgi:CheY-like chemotaxis protein
MPRPYTLSVSLSAAVVSQISVNGEVWGGVFGLSTSSRYLDASACAAIDLYIDFLGTEIARVEELAEWQPTQAPAAEPARTVSLDLDHVLVVEDDAIIALDLAKSLVRFGVGVVEIANSEKDALDYLDVETPDFVLLDFHLGAENALEVARVLSERGIPFALATGSARDDLSVSDLGNPPVLEKPVDPDELQIVLGKANAA